MAKTKKKALVTALTRACEFPAHYGGDLSDHFWREVLRQVDEEDRSPLLYDLACVLQEVEARVVRILNAGVHEGVTKIVDRERDRV